MSHLLIQSDARRIPLADGSVHAVITSPPYYSLRDYQTGQWVGGDADCDHRGSPQQSAASTLAGNGHGNGKPLSPALQAQHVPYRDLCGKCGARRIDRQIGLEATVAEYVATMVQVFREVWRVLHNSGTAWVNLGDSYSSGGRDSYCPPSNREVRHTGFTDTIPPRPDCGLKPKNLLGIPWRVAFALQADGWILRSDIIWSKVNPMPESCTDRPTKSHEYIFLLAKQERYYYDADAVREKAEYGRRSNFRGGGGYLNQDRNHGNSQRNSKSSTTAGSDPEAGRNMRSVLNLPSESFAGAHFATFPRKLVEPCIKAGTSERGACPECGNPWQRVTATEQIAKCRNLAPSKYGNGRNSEQGGSWTAAMQNQTRRIDSTLGWRPTCTHEAEPVPGLVLDPFAGSGTTGVVALALGRRFVGLDLSREYLDMAERRISRPHAPIVRNGRAEHHPLFGEVTA